MATIPVNTSEKIKEKYTVSNNSYHQTVKNNPKDKIEVEIGDSKQPDFLPQVKIMRWDNEVNFSMRHIDNEPGQAQVKEENGVIKYIKPKLEVHQYDKPEAGEDGGFEFEWILKEKPASNVLQASINTKELDFFYQPALTPEEIAEGASRPENVIGSYAVYHKSKANNFVGGKEYKTGKAFHIYRPQVIDANNNKVWANLSIEGDVLSVTVPQDFLDSAVYPVIVDPTFGYTSVGATNFNAPSLAYGLKGATMTYTAGSGDQITQFSVYGQSTSTVAEMAVYTIPSTALSSRLAAGVSITIATSSQWNNSAAVSQALTNGTKYGIAVGAWSTSTNLTLKQDTGSSNDSSAKTPKSLDASWSEFASENRRISMYATYATVSKRYARAGGGNWSSDSTWSTTSGGAADTVAPTAADDVVLDANSGNVTIDADAACRSIDCNGYTGTLTHNSGVTLSIGDATAGDGNRALRFVSGMTYTLGSGTTSAISFISTSATVQDIDFAGKTTGNITFNATSGGSWRLTGTLGTSSVNASQVMTLTKGTLDTNGQTVNIGSFSSSNSNTRSLTLGASTINLYATSGSPWNTGTISNLTLSAASSTIKIASTSSSSRTLELGYFAGSLTYGTIDYTLSGSTGLLQINKDGTVPTITTLNFSDASNARTLQTNDLGNAIPVVNFNVNGTSGKLMTIKTNINSGHSWTKSSGTVSIDYVNIQYSTATGGAAWYAGANSTDGGNNSGWIFSAPPTGSTNQGLSMMGVG